MHDPKISTNNYSDPPTRKFDLDAEPINPDSGVEFLCFYGKNLLRSNETSHFGQMSNVECRPEVTLSDDELVEVSVDAERFAGDMENEKGKGNAIKHS
ncbi:hypothetical protein LWI28_012353 [Acer negundo]|uniref:Uncharacterized protein n=1 Tax=Acer negundo TaxID=4023 RepID=A0AAD5NUF7_ACENE|nr:hypothetical protein LWI28_012353 [Acer negundo]